ncbi:hypothetical protein [Kiloniella majae]|nr:hypothetical protein [Kiloniella majae]
MKVNKSNNINNQINTFKNDDLKELIKLIAVAAARADFAAEKGGANDS